MTTALDRRAVQLTRDLLALRTVNPPGDEAPAAARLAGELEAAGFRTRMVELAPGRPSLIARLAGTDSEAPALGFTGHLDVVPLGQAAWTHDPFAGETAGDRLFGRGAADMKGGVAAMVAAALALAAGPRSRAGLELVLTAGEETGCAGARRIVETPGSLGRVGALVVGEPTGLVPKFGHRGVIWLHLRFSGRTAHASMPEAGDNAVLKAARAALSLAGHDFGGVAHEALGRPTLNVGRLEGGLNLNSVPDGAVLGVDVRPVPGQTGASVAAELARLVPEAEVELLVDCPPLWSDPGQAWLVEVGERAARLVAAPATPGAVPFATDAGYLAPAYGGVPTVVLGPGETEQAHRTDEWCSLTRIGQAAELYRELMDGWNG